jgi:hypothetical protein
MVPISIFHGKNPPAFIALKLASAGFGLIFGHDVDPPGQFDDKTRPILNTGS